MSAVERVQADDALDVYEEGLPEDFDRRPPPKPRKHPQLWQSYLWWDELMQMRKRHALRKIAAERGKSNYDAAFEDMVMETMQLDQILNLAAKTMAAYGKATGGIWDWFTGIHGIGDHTAAKILALLDDPARYETISKLWRFSGYGVIDGEIDRPTKGTVLPFNRRLKSELFLMAENFVRHQTPLYSGLYYEEKDRQRAEHPEPVCGKCGATARQKGKSWVCTGCRASGRSISFTPLHLHLRALRKTVKVFLSHLWLLWRQQEGLVVSEPWIIAHGGHEHMIEPLVNMGV